MQKELDTELINSIDKKVEDEMERRKEELIARFMEKGADKIEAIGIFNNAKLNMKIELKEKAIGTLKNLP